METPSPSPSPSPKAASKPTAKTNRPYQITELAHEDVPSSPSKNRLKKQRPIKVPPKKQKPIRFHRIYHGKTKRWHDNIEIEDVKPEPKHSPTLPSPQSFVRPREITGTDPFNAFGLPNDSKTDRALHHWSTVFQNTRMVITPRKPWMGINLSDKTLLSVTNYCSTSHYFFCRGAKPPQACVSQKVLAIRNINNSLRKQDSVISDYLIIGVAVMTLLECLAGSTKECAIHQKGLLLMLQKKGGLRALGFDGAPERLISWVDICCAVYQRTQPTLQPKLVPDAGESVFSRRFDIGDLRERLVPITGSEELTGDILYVWLRLRYLTEFLNNVPDHKIDDCFFSDKLDFLERRILFLLHSELLAESSAVAFITAFLNASLIYIYEDLRTCPRWTNVCMTLSTRIMSGLSMVDMTFVIEAVPDLLLWTLLLGRSGVPPIECPGIGWYASEIAAAIKENVEIRIPPVVSALRYFTLSEEARPKSYRTPPELELE